MNNHRALVLGLVHLRHQDHSQAVPGQNAFRLLDGQAATGNADWKEAKRSLVQLYLTCGRFDDAIAAGNYDIDIHFRMFPDIRRKEVHKVFLCLHFSLISSENASSLPRWL